MADPLVLSPADDVLVGRLSHLCQHGLGLEPEASDQVVQAILRSDHVRAEMLKRRFRQPLSVSWTAFFTITATPHFLCLLFEDLCDDGLLARPDASRAQEHVLTHTSRDGRWTTTDERSTR
jgi:hypothetical protein